MNSEYQHDVVRLTAACEGFVDLLCCHEPFSGSLKLACFRTFPSNSVTQVAASRATWGEPLVLVVAVDLVAAKAVFPFPQKWATIC